MKKKLLIIIGICIFVIALLVAMYFTIFKMDYTTTENGYTTSYKGSGTGTFTIKVEKETPLKDCYFHIRNDNGKILEYTVKSKTDNKIVLKIKGLASGTGSIALFINEDPDNLEEVIYGGSSELENTEVLDSGDANLDEEVTDEEEIEIFFYTATMVFDVKADSKLALLDCGISSAKDPELIFEKGDFKLLVQDLNTTYRLIVPNSKKKLSFVEEGFNVINVANTHTNDDESTYADIVGNKMGIEKLLCSSPYDDVNVVLSFTTERLNDIGYKISLVSFDGSDDVDISMFFDSTDYTLMATTLDNIPIPLRANILEYKVLSNSYDEGNEICTIDLVYNYRNISYVVTEKLTMDDLLVDVTPMMTNANVPLVEETINDINIKSYEYSDGKEIYSLIYFTIGKDNCMLTSDEATVEELKPFVENIFIKDLSDYKVAEETVEE